MKVRVRRLRDGEEHLVQQVFDGMSAQARFLRFHAPVPRLLSSVRTTLARRVEGEREPVVAMLGDRAVGLGHWIRDPKDRSRAELSVAVIDDVRGRGVGRRVTGAMAVSAAAHGVRLRHLRDGAWPSSVGVVRSAGCAATRVRGRPSAAPPARCRSRGGYGLTLG